MSFLSHKFNDEQRLTIKIVQMFILIYLGTVYFMGHYNNNKKKKTKKKQQSIPLA